MTFGAWRGTNPGGWLALAATGDVKLQACAQQPSGPGVRMFAADMLRRSGENLRRAIR